MIRKWGLALLVVVLLLVSAPASAATFKWTRLGPSLANYAQAGLTRTSDGILHVVWVRENAADPNTRNINWTPLSPDGVVGSTQPIQSGWPHIDPVPDVNVSPDGSLRAMWGGTRSITPGETNTFLNTATAPSSGTPWTLQIGNVAEGSGQFGGSVAFAYAPDGTPIEISGSAFVHRGLSPSTNYDYAAPLGGCCAYSGNIATDEATGAMHVVWFSNADPVAGDGLCNCGLYTRQVDPATGAPVGQPVRMPGSVTTFEGQEYSAQPITRMPLEARHGGGIYTAFPAGYPDVNKVLVWRIGDTDSVRVRSSSAIGYAVDVEAAPDGRMWAVWSEDTSGRPRVVASLSNETVTGWSPTVSIQVPSSLGDYVSLFEIDANAGEGFIDVFVNLSDNLADAEPGTSFWHVRLPEPPTWTTGDDVLSGGGGADFIYGGPGNDRISGKGGSDDLYGGEGRDNLNGGDGKDLLNGGPGKDTCRVTKGDKIKSCEKVLGRRNI